MTNTSNKIAKTKSKAINDTEPIAPLIAKLKTVDYEIQHYVAALEIENLKLQRQIAKFQADKVSLNSRIIILEENTNEHCVHKTPPFECLKKSYELAVAQMKEKNKR